MEKKYYIVSGLDLNEPDHKTLKITTRIPKNHRGEPTVEGWLGSWNNYTTYSHGEFLTWDDAEQWITMNYRVIQDEDSPNIFSEPDVTLWEEWFVDGWHTYYNGEKTVDEFLDNLGEMSYEDNDGNPMRVTNYRANALSWFLGFKNKNAKQETEIETVYHVYLYTDRQEVYSNAVLEIATEPLPNGKYFSVKKLEGDFPSIAEAKNYINASYYEAEQSSNNEMCYIIKTYYLNN